MIGAFHLTHVRFAVLNHFLVLAESSVPDLGGKASTMEMAEAIVAAMRT